MTDISTKISSPVLIAHQLGPEFEKAIAPHLPANVALIGLTPHAVWEIPAGAQVLVAAPPRGKNVVAPKQKPQGWPHDLRWVHTISVGVDEFPDWIFDGPIVTCGRGSNSIPLSEFVLASLLAVEKTFPEIWLDDDIETRPRREMGALHGKTLGLLGFGSIGIEVAKRARAFGLRILAHRRSEAPSPISDVEFVGFEQLLAASDHLAVLLPLTRQTRHLLDTRAFELLKPGAHIVNISRGGVIDHEALVAALESGRVGFASLDVTEPEPLPSDHPLRRHPRAHISPHISYSGLPPYQLLVELFLANLGNFLAGEPLVERVRPELGY
ncbi:dihydrofolate reductase [Methylosinus sp. H3A]|uniref:NAD(P)-dependent oxidoreductase n=1 Tax=Methylosinus sp. H3A TaxID=2785786 RepID=UPI0018C2538D|nr:NAD(P)-dependent oxidoreductase [Methylosinus sp. H3A]MBG0809977.1 dihydrofolate reductase [Methylosinus sp. H3A]